MDKKTNVYIAAPPAYTKQALKSGVPVAHIAFKIGRGFHLYRADIPLTLRGGIMIVDTEGFSGGGPISTLVSEIIGECKRFAFSGIVLNTGNKASPFLRSLTEHLAAYTKRNSLNLFVPEILADVDSSTSVMLSAAISGGTLIQHISEAVDRYGSHRLALEIERVLMDFALPSKSGIGKYLSEGELSSMIDQYHPKPFFSQEFCTYYFYYNETKRAHFVLFDNGASIRHKLYLAEKMGIENAFLFYPQVAEILSEIIRK